MEHVVSKFYHEIQFPGHYTQDEVIKKSNDFFLAEQLKLFYLPFKGKILEAGCGSGYTTHVIATLRRDAKILGIDFSKGSLEFAETFSKNNNYSNTTFKHVDLRNIDLEEKDFDMLICSGVLHHIDNPKPIFHNLCKLVKKNGVVIIGLYHPWGRFAVHVRQKIFKITGGRMRWIDPRIRNEDWSEERKITWYRDQYEHPYERDYAHQNLRAWFDDENISYIDSIPHLQGSDLAYNLYMLFRTGSQGGLYIFVGRKQ
jgi:SAM-dependent methyltransferase